MTEEIEAVDKDGRFAYKLTHENFISEVECRFLDQGEGSTMLVETTQVNFRPAMLNVVGMFLKGSMKKRRNADLQKFKDIVEQIKTK